MKICFITHEYPPNIISGLGTALVNLVKGLKDHEITIITPLARGGKTHEKIDNIEIIRVPILNSKLLNKFNLLDPRILFSLKLRSLKKSFDFKKFDLLHIYDVHDSYFIDKNIQKSIPILISVNDFYSYIIPWNLFKFPYPTKKLIIRYIHYTLTKVLNKHFLKKSKYILVNTEFLKNVLINKCNIKPSSIFHAYRGLEHKRFKVSKSKYNSKKILYLGSNMERKGVIYLIKAMPEIIKKHPDAQCTVIGKSTPKLMKEFKEILRKNEIENKVEFLPYIPSEKVPEYYEEANVFVLPALFENLAVTILEAMASQTPVICTADGANDEAIEHKKQGYIIEKKSPEQITHYVNKIFENPKKAKELGQEGLKKLKTKFAKDTMTNKVYNLYERILKNE